MLDLWRPPQGAGEPIGCLTTTYTFSPTMFDEECLGRFLQIDSDPGREDLPFFLEKESRLGEVYAGVIVDHTQAGVEHSLRWDVLSVRIPGGKQHAKLSLLSWQRCIRLIVASANLTEPGYRSNFEVADAVDLVPEDIDADALAAAIEFLRCLLRLVPQGSQRPPAIQRAEAFLGQVERQVEGWRSVRRRSTVRQQLVFTLPAIGPDRAARTSLGEAIKACRGRGGSPQEAWIASPFFDVEAETSLVAASLCKQMARGEERALRYCVPAIRDVNVSVPRLAAPKALLTTPRNYGATVTIDMLPEFDGDKNRRPWHAKMLALRANGYSALMTGSSNFTCAGMGIGAHRNAEANILTVVDHVTFGRQTGQLESVWPLMERVDDPEAAEWLGARPDNEEEEAESPALPAGFLSATYRAGDVRKIILTLAPAQLPEEWQVFACGQVQTEIISSDRWLIHGQMKVVDIDWTPLSPPEKLLVRWDEQEAFLSLNVENGGDLPAPSQLEQMSADEMLAILAASDPSAAYRAWAKKLRSTSDFDDELDSATPIDLDPLRHHDLQATFLHRIRRRARALARLRVNLQRPVASERALEWRLRGLIGIEPLIERTARAVTKQDVLDEEAWLTLADLMIVLREVDYQASDGALSKKAFDKTFRSFLSEQATKLESPIDKFRGQFAGDLMSFWDRVLEQCRS
jgi:hypothetical protein